MMIPNMFEIKAKLRTLKNLVLNISDAEGKVLEATNTDSWGASSTLMNEIADATEDSAMLRKIMEVLWSRMDQNGKDWRVVYKALTLLEHLIYNGSPKVYEDVKDHAVRVRTLLDFQFVNERGKDEGVNVREKAKKIMKLNDEPSAVTDGRKKARKNRAKYQGVSSDDYLAKHSSKDEEKEGEGKPSDTKDKGKEKKSEDGDEHEDGEHEKEEEGEESEPTEEAAEKPRTKVPSAVLPAEKKEKQTPIRAPQKEANMLMLDDSPAPRTSASTASAASLFANFDWSAPMPLAANPTAGGGVTAAGPAKTDFGSFQKNDQTAKKEAAAPKAFLGDGLGLVDLDHLSLSGAAKKEDVSSLPSSDKKTTLAELRGRVAAKPPAAAPGSMWNPAPPRF